MKEIVLYPDSTLRAKSNLVTDFGSALDRVVEEMTYATRILAHNGIGLAAVQVREPLRLGILDLNYKSKKPGKPVVMCNPIILSRGMAVVGDEGCLSFPGKFIKVKRSLAIQVQYQDQEGRTRKQFFKDMWARCVLHEMDHMDGILFIDHEIKKEENHEPQTRD